MKKTQKEKYENKKVYCLFNAEGEKIQIGKVRMYLAKGHIKTALTNELNNNINHHNYMCQIYEKKPDIKKVIEDHNKKYENIKIVEYELNPTKEINCINLIKESSKKH